MPSFSVTSDEEFFMAFIKESAMLGNHEVSIETGRMAKQASGAVLI